MSQSLKCLIPLSVLRQPYNLEKSVLCSKSTFVLMIIYGRYNGVNVIGLTIHKSIEAFGETICILIFYIINYINCCGGLKLNTAISHQDVKSHFNSTFFLWDIFAQLSFLFNVLNFSYTN